VSSELNLARRHRVQAGRGYQSGKDGERGSNATGLGAAEQVGAGRGCADRYGFGCLTILTPRNGLLRPRWSRDGLLCGRARGLGLLTAWL
jgi:hypothetical protein